VFLVNDSVNLIGQDDHGPRQYPVAIHDASNVLFDGVKAYTTSLAGVSCEDSIMLQLSNPAPLVSGFEPVACEIKATTGMVEVASSFWIATGSSVIR